jgi:hypothetical protein
MTTTSTKLQNDIAFCIDELDLSNEQIGELLRACENLSDISCEYFCEEFIVDDNTEEDIHDPEYLNIKEVNRIYYNNT